MIPNVARIAVACAVLYASACGGAIAQTDFRGGPPQPGSFPQAGPLGGNFTINNGGGPASAFQPVSNLRGLLRRSEVQHEISLDLKQKNAITALEEEAQNAIRQRIQDAMQGRNAQIRYMSQDQRRQWLLQQQQQLAQAEAAAQQTVGDLDGRVRAILRPDQLTRLHELDLQKRGPLSLGDSTVATELKLTSQTRTAESRILFDYQNSVRTLVSDATVAALQNGDPRQGNLADFTSKMSPLRKKLEANRADAEKRALDILTDEEKEAWTKAQGKPFHFRPDPIAPIVRQPQFRSG